MQASTLEGKAQQVGNGHLGFGWYLLGGVAAEALHNCVMLGWRSSKPQPSSGACKRKLPPSCSLALAALSAEVWLWGCSATQEASPRPVDNVPRAVDMPDGWTVT